MATYSILSSSQRMLSRTGSKGAAPRSAAAAPAAASSPSSVLRTAHVHSRGESAKKSKMQTSSNSRPLLSCEGAASVGGVWCVVLLCVRVCACAVRWVVVRVAPRR